MLGLGLFLLLVAAASLYATQRVGHLLDVRMRMQNAADATAHSAGVLAARLFNFLAYVNRAIAANEADLGRLSALSSWQALMPEAAQSYALGQPGGAILIARGLPSVALTVVPATTQQARAQTAITQRIRRQADAHEQAKRRLRDAAHAVQPAFVATRRALREGLLAANLGALPSPQPAYERHPRGSGVQGINAEDLRGADRTAWLEIQRGAARAPLLRLTVAALRRDPFVADRHWMAIGMMPCVGPLPGLDLIVRRGSTDSIGHGDGWRSEDSLTWVHFAATRQCAPTVSRYARATGEPLSTGLPEYYALSAAARHHVGAGGASRSPAYLWRVGYRAPLAALEPRIGPSGRLDLWRSRIDTTVPPPHYALSSVHAVHGSDRRLADLQFPGWQSRLVLLGEAAANTREDGR